MLMLKIYGVWVLVVSLVTFVLYGWDKRKAQGDGWRVPEARLHLLELVGGWPGALIGQRVFRHKTSKLSFQVVFWLMVLMNVAAVVGVWAVFYRG